MAYPDGVGAAVRSSEFVIYISQTPDEASVGERSCSYEKLSSSKECHPLQQYLSFIIMANATNPLDGIVILQASWEANSTEDLDVAARDADWENFAITLSEKELSRLDEEGVQYRISVPGAT